MSNTDWIKALANSPVAKLNPHLVQVSDTKAKSDAARKSSKGKSKYLSEMHFQLFAWCKENKVQLLQEHKFHEFRKYRFDFAIKEMMLGIEYEGGVLMDKSGHKSIRNYQKDVEKYNLAQSLGWRVIRFTVLNYKSVIQEIEKFNE